MDEKTATQLAAQQIVNELGTAAGFMIALRLIQVIAERSGNPTPELVEAFAACLKGMEHFAQMANLSPAPTPSPDAGAANPEADAGSAVKVEEGAPGVTNGSRGSGSNGTPLA